jgi:HK97 family phage prohead protease
MEFEIGNMVHYVTADGDGFGVIEAMDDNGYTVRVYASAEGEFTPTDIIVETDTVHDVESYADEQMAKAFKEFSEPDNDDEYDTMSAGDFIEWDTEDGKARGIVKMCDETGKMTAEVIESGEKTGIEIELEPGMASKIEPFEVAEPKAKTRFVGKIKSVKMDIGENEQGEKVGIIEGYLSVYGNTDLGGDVVRKGAFTQTLMHNNGRFKLLLDHGYHTRDMAGMFYATDDEKGLFIKAEMPLDIGYIADAYKLIKFNTERGVPCGLSIGYDVVNAAPNKSGGYDLTELKLMEGSITPFPMNEAAMITSVKSNKYFQPKAKAAKATSDAQGAKALEALLLKSIQNLTEDITQ